MALWVVYSAVGGATAPNSLSAIIHKLRGGDSQETGAVGVGSAGKSWLQQNGYPQTTGYTSPVYDEGTDSYRVIIEPSVATEFAAHPERLTLSEQTTLTAALAAAVEI